MRASASLQYILLLSLACVSPVLATSPSSLVSEHLPRSTSSTAPPHPTQAKTFLEATAIVTDSKNNSALECWRLADPFATSGDAGTAGAATMNINFLTNATYTVLPPRFEGGVHNAPNPQLVIFISGVAHVTLPHGTDDAFVVGGQNGLIFALDTVGTGHNTSYPSNTETIGWQIPFATVPPHVVINSGACTSASQIVSSS